VVGDRRAEEPDAPLEAFALADRRAQRRERTVPQRAHDVAGRAEAAAAAAAARDLDKAQLLELAPRRDGAPKVGQASRSRTAARTTRGGTPAAGSNAASVPSSA